jgi:hypothetical protein
VRGGASEAIADMASELSLKIGSLVLHRPESEARQNWTPAAIRGSRRTKSSMPLLDRRETACVVAIDGRAIPREREKWDKDLPLAPGRHGIGALYFDSGGVATCEFLCDARPGARYQLRFEDGPDRTVRFWIADLRSGRPVGVWIADPVSGRLAPVIFAERRISNPRPLPIVIDRRMLRP